MHQWPVRLRLTAGYYRGLTELQVYWEYLSLFRHHYFLSIDKQESLRRLLRQYLRNVRSVEWGNDLSLSYLVFIIG